jgi:hypothetical protein
MTDRKTIWHYGTYLDLDYKTLEQAKKYIEELIVSFGKDAKIFEENEGDSSHFAIRVPRLESDADYEMRKRHEAAQQARLDEYDRQAYERLKAKFG